MLASAVDSADMPQLNHGGPGSEDQGRSGRPQKAVAVSMLQPALPGGHC